MISSTLQIVSKARGLNILDSDTEKYLSKTDKLAPRIIKVCTTTENDKQLHDNSKSLGVNENVIKINSTTSKHVDDARSSCDASASCDASSLTSAQKVLGLAIEVLDVEHSSVQLEEQEVRYWLCYSIYFAIFYICINLY